MLKTLTQSLLSVIILVCFVKCKFGEEPQKKAGIKEFEGVITYHEITKNSDSTFNSDDTVQLFYSHGNYVCMHSDGSPKFHLVKDYYFESKPLRLWLFNNSDTLHQLSLKSAIEKLDSFKVKKINDQILSRKCEEIDLNTSYAEKDFTTYSNFTFIVSKGYLTVDKEHFKNWNLGFFNKVINESGAFYLKFKAVHFDSSHKRILSSKTRDVISVKVEAVDPKIFEIDTTKIK